MPSSRNLSCGDVGSRLAATALLKSAHKITELFGLSSKDCRTLQWDIYSSCVDNVQQWLSKNSLLLSTAKTKAIIIGHKSIIQSGRKPSHYVNMEKIDYFNTARNLGVLFDTELSFKCSTLCSARGRPEARQPWKSMPTDAAIYSSTSRSKPRDVCSTVQHLSMVNLLCLDASPFTTRAKLGCPHCVWLQKIWPREWCYTGTQITVYQWRSRATLYSGCIFCNERQLQCWHDKTVSRTVIILQSCETTIVCTLI